MAGSSSSESSIQYMHTWSGLQCHRKRYRVQSVHKNAFLTYTVCSAVVCTTPVVWSQASQVRKSNYVPQKRVDYDPDKSHTCTVYAGTMVQQVILLAPCLYTCTCTQGIHVGNLVDLASSFVIACWCHWTESADLDAWLPKMQVQTALTANKITNKDIV